MALHERIEIVPRRKLADERGWFLKVINGRERGLPDHTGEVYITCATEKGDVRGNHYHRKATEWFTLIDGQCLLKLEDVDSGESLTIELNQDDPKTLVIPPGVAHAFINSDGNRFLLLAYTDELYDPADTIAFRVG